jgi:hypothetical protein
MEAGLRLLCLAASLGFASCLEFWSLGSGKGGHLAVRTYLGLEAARLVVEVYV